MDRDEIVAAANQMNRSLPVVMSCRLHDTVQVEGGVSYILLEKPIIFHERWKAATPPTENFRPICSGCAAMFSLEQRTKFVYIAHQSPTLSFGGCCAPPHQAFYLLCCSLREKELSASSNTYNCQCIPQVCLT